MDQRDYGTSHALSGQFMNNMSNTSIKQTDATTAVGVTPPIGLTVASPVGVVTSPVNAPQMPHYQYGFHDAQQVHRGSVGHAIDASQPINYQYQPIAKTYNETSAQQGYSHPTDVYGSVSYQQYSSDGFSKAPPLLPLQPAANSEVTEATAQSILQQNGSVAEDLVESAMTSVTSETPVIDTILSNHQSAKTAQGDLPELVPQSEHKDDVTLIAAYDAKPTEDPSTYVESFVPQLRTTFESAKFWLQCAENASERAAKFDPNIGAALHKAVLDGMNQFLVIIKDASQKCIDDATKHVPELSLNPASLMPPIEQASIDNGAGKDSCDIKPDPKSLASALATDPVSSEMTPPANDALNDDYQDTTVDEDDDEDYVVTPRKTGNKKRKSRRLKKWREPRRKVAKRDRSKSDVSALTCDECGTVFMSRDELLAHIEIVHPGKHPLTCEHCLKTYASARAVKKHVNEVHNKNKQCDLCEKRFAYKYELDNHRLSKHKKSKDQASKRFNPSAVFLCSICQYSASRLHNLKAHVRFKHADTLEGGNDIMEYISESTQEDAAKSAKEKEESTSALAQYTTVELSCMICSENFSTKRSLDKHLKTHIDPGADAESSAATLRCKECFKRCADVGALYAHMRRVHGRQFKCKFCAKVFTVRYQLEAHLRYHLNLRPYRCDSCTTGAFPSLMALYMHTRIKHPQRSKQKPYKCVRCLQDFTFKIQLRQHIERQHAFDRTLLTADPLLSADAAAISARSGAIDNTVVDGHVVASDAATGSSTETDNAFAGADGINIKNELTDGVKTVAKAGDTAEPHDANTASAPQV